MNKIQSIKYFNNDWLDESQQSDLLQIIDYEIKNYLCSYKTKYQSLLNQQLRYHDNKTIQFICTKFQKIINETFNFKTKILTCWFVMVKQDSKFNFHYHPGSHFTGVYYLKNCKNNGTIFKSPKGEFQILCEDNTGIFFDSNILHSTPLWNGSDRYVVTVDLIKI
jgi:hypothetical protein